VFVSDFENHRVQKWAPGATSGVIVAGGNGAGDAMNQLYWPRGIVLDRLGNLYIADLGNNRILKYAPGSTTGELIIRESGSVQLIAFSDSNRIYYLDPQNYATFCAPRAVGTGTWNRYRTYSYQLDNPSGITLDAANNLYIVEDNTSRVLKFTPGSSVGTVVAGGNGDGNAANQLIRPEGITVDASGNLYIADNKNHRVQKWAPGATSGITVAGGKFGPGPECLSWPKDVKLDLAGNIYVADIGNNRVQKWPKM
jgi:DNA-binding beta-propeller fold protein YncE